MISIPQNIQDLVSYKPGKPIAQLVEELQLEEWAVLWNNENNLGPSPKAVQQIEAALSNSHLYPDPSATQLCELIAAQNNCTADCVTVDNGSESVFDCMFRAFFEGDDELLTCDGTFVAVYIWAKANGVPCARIPLARGYQFDLDRLVESITPQTKAIYIANPNNPTGAIITKTQFEQLVEVVPDHVLIIMDEAYYEYAKVISDEYPDSFSLGKPNVITLRTFSKAYGIAGVRVGYALGDPRLIEAIRKVRMTFAPSNLAQAAGIGAIMDAEHVNKTVTLNKSALQQFYVALHDAELNYIPSYGNFVMVDLKTEDAAKEFTDDMMQKGIFIRHLRAFGLPHCVRISTGTEAENDLFAKVLVNT